MSAYQRSKQNEAISPILRKLNELVLEIKIYDSEFQCACMQIYGAVTAGAESAVSWVGFPFSCKLSLSVPGLPRCPRGIHVAGHVFLLGAALNLLNTRSAARRSHKQQIFSWVSCPWRLSAMD